MNQDPKTLRAIMTITQISNNYRLRFEEKLKQIIHEVVKCMGVEKGSIMLLKGRKTLEVVASTHHELVGLQQSIEEQSPSAWVVKNKQLLYMDEKSKSDKNFQKQGKYKKCAFLLAPIQHRQKILGVLSLTEKIGEDRFSHQEQEALLGIVGYLISSIENQRLNLSLKKSKKVLQQKNQQLKALEKIRTELFNMLIHDLKGPISEVMANLDILSYTASGENKEYVTAAQTGCDTLYHMVLDLLDIARLEDGSLKVIYERINPREFIKEALSLVYGQARTKTLELMHKEPGPNENIPLYADRTLLLRVMQNLLVNAIHHSPHGQVIEVGYLYTDKHIQFFVKDNGPGVAPEFQRAIFDKFFQVQKKQDGRRFSTGLGLTFCKLAAEAHRGDIHVTSDGVKGSRFVFEIPIKTP